MARSLYPFDGDEPPRGMPMLKARLRSHATPAEDVDASAPLLGFRVERDGTRFGAYVTAAKRCAVRLYGPDGAVLGTHAMSQVVEAGESDDVGFFQAHVAGVGEGALYKLVLDDTELPDPWARFLPHGVHGPAMVVEQRHPWQQPPRSRPMSDHVIYELHVGTFSERGTYAGVAEHIVDLVGLGITTVELMPLAAFAGNHGWGYDGVAWFAPFAPYGTPDELRALVDALHAAGLSVILDVVYNHFGPDGAFLRQFSPDYFTSRHKNAWGDSLDYEHPVLRRMIVDNARYWLEDFRFDGLRLDAIHAIVDPSPEHILAELAYEVRQLEPPRVLIAEDDRNDPTCVTQWGLDAVWADDFHHAVRVKLTGEHEGYYAAYPSSAATIAETIDNGWLYRGQVSPDTGRPRGEPAHSLEPWCFVYCIENHDQVGNRALGDRLSATLSVDPYRAVSTLLLFLPMTPLLFMGQEWAATSPFLYFTDHEPNLGKLIALGRRDEFKGFSAFSDPAARQQIPDPQAPDTFARSRLRWAERGEAEAMRTLELYRALIALRSADPVLRNNVRQGLSARAEGDLLLVRRRSSEGIRQLAVNLGPSTVTLASAIEPPSQRTLVLSSGAVATDRDELPPWTAVIFAVTD